MEQPLAEYQGSIHFQNTKGIRAECADCHVPHQPIDYLLTKVAALKDVYGEVTGKIDTPEKYEAHKLAMAQSVWDTLKKNDSATCRSCHSYDAMDVTAQNLKHANSIRLLSRMAKPVSTAIKALRIFYLI